MCVFCMASCVVGQSGLLGGHFPPVPMPRSCPVSSGLCEAQVRGEGSQTLTLAQSAFSPGRSRAEQTRQHGGVRACSVLHGQQSDFVLKVSHGADEFISVASAVVLELM